MAEPSETLAEKLKEIEKFSAQFQKAQRQMQGKVGAIIEEKTTDQCQATRMHGNVVWIKCNSEEIAKEILNGLK